jgi:TonB family protein
MKHLLTVLLLSSFVLTTHAEQTEVSRLIETAIIKDAKPLERTHPRYPVTAARKSQEGWVKLSFVIDKDGDVVEPIIEDSSGIKGFEKAAMRAIKDWKYSPATQDGKPIEQCKSTVQLDFRLEGKSGVSRRFYQKYKKVSKAIEEKDFQLAEQILTELLEKKLWNTYENDWYWLADSLYANAIKDYKRELNSIERASNGGLRTVGEDNHIYILQRKFSLQVNHQLYSNALQTFKTLQNAQGVDKTPKTFASYANKIREIISSDDAMVRNAIIGDRGHVYHPLSRNRFQLSDVQGPLKELEIRCDNKRSRFTAVEDSIWKIPANWGQCNVFFKGKENTKFNIIELANQA